MRFLKRCFNQKNLPKTNLFGTGRKNVLAGTCRKRRFNQPKVLEADLATGNL